MNSPICNYTIQQLLDFKVDPFANCPGCTNPVSFHLNTQANIQAFQYFSSDPIDVVSISNAESTDLFPIAEVSSINSSDRVVYKIF